MGPELPPAHLNNYSHRFLRFYSLHPSPNTNGFVWVLGCKHEKLTPDGKVIYWKDTKEIDLTMNFWLRSMDIYIFKTTSSK